MGVPGSRCGLPRGNGLVESRGGHEHAAVGTGVLRQE